MAPFESIQKGHNLVINFESRSATARVTAHRDTASRDAANATQFSVIGFVGA